MRPSLCYHTLSASPAYRHPAMQRPDFLDFRPMTMADMQAIAPLLNGAPWRTCDFTVGGMLLWAEWFGYSACIIGDTLFVRGADESDPSRPAFSVPAGAMPLEQSLRLVTDHCRRHGIEPRFSAVPEEALPAFRALGAREITELPDWADYLYEASALATLSGKKLNKKRNHVNRFMADHPDYRFEPITPADIDTVRAFYAGLPLASDKPAMAQYERRQVCRVLANPDAWPFEGAVLSIDGGKTPVAFTFGEIIGDTLHVHIEKMRHDINGAGETVNKMFAEMMLGRHPEIRFINRQDDAGDTGLRHAKESYHPVQLLKKYDVVL